MFHYHLRNYQDGKLDDINTDVENHILKPLNLNAITNQKPEKISNAALFELQYNLLANFQI